MNKVPPAHRAQALGFRALSRLRGETVKYYINATTFVEIANAILTRPKAKADQVGSVMILAHHWDWFDAPDALENGDGQIIPQRGIGLFFPAMEHVTTSNRTMAKTMLALVRWIQYQSPNPYQRANMTPVIALAQLLVTTLNAVTSKTFTRAYVS